MRPPPLSLHIRFLKASEEPEVVMCSPVTPYQGVVYWICCLRDVTDKGLIDGAVNKYLGSLTASATAALDAKGKETMEK